MHPPLEAICQEKLKAVRGKVILNRNQVSLDTPIAYYLYEKRIDSKLGTSANRVTVFNHHPIGTRCIFSLRQS
jgi:hypothetical protein